MFCSGCGKQIDDNLKFCTFCGARVGQGPQASTNPTPQPNPNEAFIDFGPDDAAAKQAVFGAGQVPPNPAPYPQPQPQYYNGAPGYGAPTNIYVNQYPQTGFGQSYFDGGLLQLIGWGILGALITMFTLGLGLPWAYCMIYNWEIKHTVIDGRRLSFDGTAIGLFGNWIKWWFLTLITFGIYSFWLGIALKKWKVSHTHFA